ncbi:MAG TPA: mevalonate kinase, partial [Patescibacteria group bacterium]
QRLRATVELLDNNEFILQAPDVQILNYKKIMTDLGKGDIPKGAKFVELAVKNFLSHVEMVLNNFGLKIVTKSEFSSEFGFGSSSAATVCVIKALAELFGNKLSKKEIFDLSYKTVLDIQGKGSGFDVAAAVYGGTLYFVTGGKSIKRLKIDSLPLIVGYSGVKADTVTLMNQVKAKADKYPKIIEGIYSEIEQLIPLAQKAIVKQDWATVGDLMNINQGYLGSLGVSTRKVENMIYAACDAGAYGAKLSGAGGGDCIIVFAPDEKRKRVEAAIIDAGGKVIKIQTNAEGVRVEL